MTESVIVLSHGSKREESNAVFQQLVAKVKERIDYEFVRGAVMEFSAPKLAAVVKDLAAKEVDKIIIVPLFLFPGAHVQDDLPKAVEKLQTKYPAVKFETAASIGADAKLVELIEDKV